MGCRVWGLGCRVYGLGSRVQGLGLTRVYMGGVQNWGPFRGPFLGVPYYLGDRKRDPTLENYPYREIVEQQTKDKINIHHHDIRGSKHNHTYSQ